MQKAFTKQGMKVITGAKLQGVRKEAGGVAAIVEVDGKVTEIKADRLISAVGIVGNVEDLGLEGTKVKVDRTPCRDRRVRPHRRARRLCHRRPGRPALARPQGDA